MRRALVLAGVIVLGMLAVVPAAFAAEASSHDVKFELRADGFQVAVKSEIGGGPEKLVLTLYRKGEVANYVVPAEFTEDTVKARFGQLGELDYTFTPASRAGPCSEYADGTFRGAFYFTGENEYVKFEVDQARGTFLTFPANGCKQDRRAVSGSESDAMEDEASLLAHTARPLPLRSLLVFEGEAKHRRYVFFSAFEEEKEEGMLIARGAQTAGPRGDFTWNLKAGTARITPPAPFSGSATFKRRPGGHSAWRGSLRAPVLGGQPFRLAGSDFQAQLLKGSPLD